MTAKTPAKTAKDNMIVASQMAGMNIRHGVINIYGFSCLIVTLIWPLI